MGGRDDPISDELIALCDIISPNQTEVKRLFSDEGEESKESHSLDAKVLTFLQN